jgi:hypothetical protein
MTPSGPSRPYDELLTLYKALDVRCVAAEGAVAGLQAVIATQAQQLSALTAISVPGATASAIAIFQNAVSSAAFNSSVITGVITI